MVDPLTPSLDVGAVNDGVAVQSIVASAPCGVIVGPCVSTDSVAKFEVTGAEHAPVTTTK